MRQRTVTHKNITRVDHAASKTYGYSVRVQWQGEMHSKFFSDSKHGDRLGTLAAAIAWRDATEKAIGKPRTERQVVGLVYSSSGIPGVRKVRDGTTDYYEATWGTTAGKMGRTRYSINKHGDAKALQLAKAARLRGEKARLRMPARADT